MLHANAICWQLLPPVGLFTSVSKWQSEGEPKLQVGKGTENRRENALRLICLCALRKLKIPPHSYW